MKNYELLSGAIGLMMAIGILWMIRRDHMHVQYSMWWMVLAIGAVVLGFFPRLVDVVGGALGIAYPPILAIVVGVGLILVKMLTMDIDRSRQEQKIRRLVQRLAIYEEDLDSSQKNQPKGM